MALAVGFTRALIRKKDNKPGTSGSTRSGHAFHILIPICFLFATVFTSKGVIQTFRSGGLLWPFFATRHSATMSTKYPEAEPHEATER